MKKTSSATTSCSHFNHCGGCKFAASDDAYYSTKTQTAAGILSRLGGSGELQEIFKIGAGQRRRAEFRVQKNKGQTRLGFSAAQSFEVVEIAECLVLAPEIVEFLHKLRQLLPQLKKPDTIERVSITALPAGLDCNFFCKNKFSDADFAAISQFCTDNKILRSYEIYEEKSRKIFGSAAEISFGGFAVELPTNAFLQATEAAQNHITNFALSHLASHKKIADLYCGAGTYSLPLVAAGHVVSAFEGSYDMVLALNAAIAKHGLEGQLQAQQRDLYKKPMPAHELQKFDAALINPPRNGALPQIQQLAKARLPKIVMISCSPASFERDAAYLIKNGYELKILQPIDQFFLSNHLELASVFELV